MIKLIKKANVPPAQVLTSFPVILVQVALLLRPLYKSCLRLQFTVTNGVLVCLVLWTYLYIL